MLRQYLYIQLTREEAIQQKIPYLFTTVEEEIKKSNSNLKKRKRQGQIPFEILQEAHKKRCIDKLPFNQVEMYVNVTLNHTISNSGLRKAIRQYDLSLSMDISDDEEDDDDITMKTESGEDEVESNSSSTSSTSSSKLPSIQSEKVKKAIQDIKMHEDIKLETIFEYRGSATKIFKGPTAVDMVEVHVDCFSDAYRQKHGTYRLIHGIKICMGGCLSVRYTPSMGPIVIKEGQDESNFKQNSLSSKTWRKDGRIRCESKSQGRGNMKVVWCDEIFGLGFNHLPLVIREKFQIWRPRRKKVTGEDNTFFHLMPALIHWVYDMEAKDKDGNVTSGYWTAALMLDATHEFLDLFEFLYCNGNDQEPNRCTDLDGNPIEHMAVINLDYSSNHDAMAPDVAKANNFKSGWGARRTKNKTTGEWIDLPPVRGSNVDGSDTMKAGDLGSDIPTFGTKQGRLETGAKQFYIFQKGDPVPHFEKNKKLKKDEYIGKDKGLKQILWERGLYVDGMVLEVQTATQKQKQGLSQINDRKWQVHDLVIFEDVDGEEKELFRVTSVPKEHLSCKSNADQIKIEHLVYRQQKPKFGTPGDYYYVPSGKFFTQTAKDLSGVPPSEYEVVAGKMKNKQKCWIKMDMEAVWAKLNGKEDGIANMDNGNSVDDINFKLAIVDDPNKDKDTFNPLDMKQVWNRTTTSKSVKSLVEQLINSRGHELLMSAKFHCECAGQGIEYCFGRVKWWYNKYHRHTSDGLREDSAASFLPEVVSIHHMRKFARKCRDYMRVYRATADWVDQGENILVRTENCVKALKTHRCAMDTDLVFVSAEIEADTVDYNK